MSELVLYRSPISSAVRRVEIALKLKGLEYREVRLDLAEAKRSGHDYRRINPQTKVPSLAHGDIVLTQSLAILEYLEEAFPAVPLLPKAPVARARARMLAQIVACEIHPLQNTWVARWMQAYWNTPEEKTLAWQRHWIAEGLRAIEDNLGADPFCVGASPSIADCCVIPQVANAHAYEIDMTPYPKVLAIERRCLQIAAFQPG